MANTQNRRQLTGTEVDKLSSNLQKLLADPDCGKFINAMLGSLPNDAWRTSRYDGSLMDAFNRIKNGGGFWSGDTGVAAASTDANTLSMTFHDQRTTPSISSDQAWRQLGATLTVVHELTHVFTKTPNEGAYGHLQMAQAASTAGESLHLDVKAALMLDFPTTQKHGTGSAYDVALCAYYDRTMAYACRKVKL